VRCTPPSGWIAPRARRPRASAVTRTRGLATLLLALIGLGLLGLWRWPASEPALDCAPEQIRLVDGGSGALLAVCGGEGARPAGAAALALGQRLDLNAASEEELALLPGVGRSLARRLVAERAGRGRFRGWDEVDAVPGVGDATLRTLQAALELR
jgi:competence protein ComEA